MYMFDVGLYMYMHVLVYKHVQYVHWECERKNKNYVCTGKEGGIVYM